MQHKLLQAAEASSLRTDALEFEIGDTVDVHQRILEGDKERIQIFNGVVIARRHGEPARTSPSVALWRVKVSSVPSRSTHQRSRRSSSSVTVRSAEPSCSSSAIALVRPLASPNDSRRRATSDHHLQQVDRLNFTSSAPDRLAGNSGVDSSSSRECRSKNQKARCT